MNKQTTSAPELQEIPQELHSPLFSDESSICDLIIRDISNGEFKAGERLVTTKLAGRYAVSVNPIREALKQLQGKGLATYFSNSGYRVTKYEAKHMRDVFEILQLLDPYLIRWFVENHDDKDMKVLTDIMAKMAKISPQDHVSYRNLDTQFHWYMYQKHYNQSAVDLWCQKRLVLQIMHANLPINRSRISKSLDEHEALLTAISQHDVERSTQILQSHITTSGDYWSKYF